MVGCDSGATAASGNDNSAATTVNNASNANTGNNNNSSNNNVSSNNNTADTNATVSNPNNNNTSSSDTNAWVSPFVQLVNTDGWVRSGGSPSTRSLLVPDSFNINREQSDITQWLTFSGELSSGDTVYMESLMMGGTHRDRMWDDIIEDYDTFGIVEFTDIHHLYVYEFLDRITWANDISDLFS